MPGVKGKSGRKSKRFEFEVNRLKELSLKRAIKTLEIELKIDPENPLEGLRDTVRLDKRKDEVMLKVLDKAIPTKIEGEDGEVARHFTVVFPEGVNLNGYASRNGK